MNTKCDNLCEEATGEYTCLIKMDMCYCGDGCSYATNMPCSNKEKRYERKNRRTYMSTCG